MTIDELRARIDEIEAMADDPESLHAAEDDLMKQWLLENTRFSIRSQFQRLWAMDFPRRYA